MSDYFLKFNSEDEAVTLLTDFQGSTDVIGVISKPTTEITEEGPVMALLPGWHVNIRGELTEEQLITLLPFSIEPKQPIRVWA
jgi:hypothetical protein